jgi:hypothetical protein
MKHIFKNYYTQWQHINTDFISSWISMYNELYKKLILPLLTLFPPCSNVSCSKSHLTVCGFLKLSLFIPLETHLKNECILQGSNVSILSSLRKLSTNMYIRFIWLNKWLCLTSRHLVDNWSHLLEYNNERKRMVKKQI